MSEQTTNSGQFNQLGIVEMALDFDEHIVAVTGGILRDVFGPQYRGTLARREVGRMEIVI
ncbi:MAG: hypothetical protein ABL891_06670 [Burkholderiales bacterium]